MTILNRCLIILIITIIPNLGFGRYYDIKISRWISADPPLARGTYLPVPSDLDTDHDYYWQYNNDKTAKLPGMGGVYSPINLDAYQYGGQNPVKYIDPDGNTVVGFLISENFTPGIGIKFQKGLAIDSSGKLYKFDTTNLTLGLNIGLPSGSFFYSSARTAKGFFNQQYITLEGNFSLLSGEIGVTNTSRGAEYLFSLGGEIKNNKLRTLKFLKILKGGANFNFIAEATSKTEYKEFQAPKKALEILNVLKKNLSLYHGSETEKMMNNAIKYYENKSK